MAETTEEKVINETQEVERFCLSNSIYFSKGVLRELGEGRI